MAKRFIVLILSFLCLSIYTYGIDAWIRINQLGYLPNAAKKAVFISETLQKITVFSIHDALTNEELAQFSNSTSKGEFLSYKSTYILDFSEFKIQGAFYIKAGLIYSPTIYINKNVYLGTADFLLNYLRKQRCCNNFALDSTCNQHNSYITKGENTKLEEAISKNISEKASTTNRTKLSKSSNDLQINELLQPKTIDLKGGWQESSDCLQYGATSANAIFQLLFSYLMNPTAFADTHDAVGKKNPNKIPDILDEAKWGLDWLLKMYPTNNNLFHQIGDDNNPATFRLAFDNQGDKDLKAIGRPAYLATGKPQGLFNNKNGSTGIASIAGKYASAFALGANTLATFYPLFADTLSEKAIQAYEYGKNNPGVCQTVRGKSPNYYTEDNWADDMELAATQLYRLTYRRSYLQDAANYGRMEPITPWMCSDTARHHQWYPFINIGHYMLATVENPRYQKEFLQNMLNGIQRMSLQASENPFNIGIPMIRQSNNLITALATQCRLYRTMTNDSSYLEMEMALIDWLFGRNPWGTSMIVGLQTSGDSPTNTHSLLWHKNQTSLTGGLVAGPVYKSVFNNSLEGQLSKPDEYERFQSDWAVYHDDKNDYLTNELTLDGTASLTYLLSGKQIDGVGGKTSDKNEYTFGGITRTDPSKKQICLVFSGHEYADGYKTISKALKKLNIKASFFLTGDFYRNRRFSKIIKGLQKDNHYLGIHSDKHLLYSSLQKRDSMFVNKSVFLTDLKANYKAMEKYDIQKKNTAFFLPPNKWYNDSISKWSKEVGVQLINFTPGTFSNADNTIPEMRSNYFSSTEIFNKILQAELKEGLNGNIMLFHIGSDKRRQDKFYPRLYSLLIELSRAGYDFVDLYQGTDIVEKNTPEQTKKK